MGQEDVGIHSSSQTDPWQFKTDTLLPPSVSMKNDGKPVWRRGSKWVEQIVGSIATSAHFMLRNVWHPRQNVSGETEATGTS